MFSSPLLHLSPSPMPPMAWLLWVTSFLNGECPSASNPRLCSGKPAGPPSSSHAPRVPLGPTLATYRDGVGETHCPWVPVLPHMGTGLGLSGALGGVVEVLGLSPFPARWPQALGFLP